MDKSSFHWFWYLWNDNTRRVWRSSGRSGGKSFRRSSPEKLWWAHFLMSERRHAKTYYYINKYIYIHIYFLIDLMNKNEGGREREKVIYAQDRARREKEDWGGTECGTYREGGGRFSECSRGWIGCDLGLPRNWLYTLAFAIAGTLLCLPPFLSPASQLLLYPTWVLGFSSDGPTTLGLAIIFFSMSFSSK